MSLPLTSLIIPSFQHARYLPDAVQSALDQTAPVEVIVVDDGSTDGTREFLENWARPHPNLKLVTQPHQGVAAARNLGLHLATGTYVGFLDADDVIADTKVARQVEALEARPEVGWCLCDTLIREVDHRSELASVRYDYAGKHLGGWVFGQLSQQNLIPVMAPLVRRAVIEADPPIRFNPDLAVEDWYFWMEVAKRARLCTIPFCGGIYEKREGGRHATSRGARPILPPWTPPLRLNLGCGTPGTASWHPMPGLLNLDRSLGWRFQDGLHTFETASVAGITISHALMYLPEEGWPAFFAECLRVLQPGGVLRITEDDCDNPRSSRLGGWKGSEPAIAMTSATRLIGALAAAGFAELYDLGPDETRYPDQSLVQHQHGLPPDVFFVEGVKRA